MTKKTNHKRNSSLTDMQRRDLESSTFLRRLIAFQVELQKRSFPNASTLAALCKCSRSTAMRTIDRLRYEFGVPLEYDESNRGYFLTDKNFVFEPMPLSRDEFIALVVVCGLSQLIDDKNLRGAVEALWARSTNARTELRVELERMRKRFSAWISSSARVPSVDVVTLLSLSHRHQPVEVKYECPWNGGGCEAWQGVFDKLFFRDGVLWASLLCTGEVSRTLNVSFIRSVSEVSQIANVSTLPTQAKRGEQRDLPCDGVWFGANAVTVEVRIRAPGSRFYSAQRWHEAQEDYWEGDVLVRRFPGGVGFETARRLLSLGRDVESIDPPSILEIMRADVENLVALFAPA